MDLNAAHMGIIIVVVLIFWELVKLTTAYFFKKVNGEEYLTKSDCQKCHSAQDIIIEDIQKCLSEIRQLLLIVAVKSGVDPKELKNLTKYNGA